MLTDPLREVTHYERDAFGGPVAITGPLGAVTRLEWTVEGRLARRIEADGTKQSRCRSFGTWKSRSPEWVH
ncbi:RHS repeat domain-containing protein [uncultured Streptomyces sp.]|uniref:RHS repeat domain-containing protein n=1 Tax=uncultured Streptomyces sp. TaxID=174707 RepID=UPI003419105C